MAELSTVKLPLPAFLKILTSNGVPAAKAMVVTGKIYKTYNTPALLAELTDTKLRSAGVDDKEERRLVVAAVRKAGYKPVLQRKQPKTESSVDVSVDEAAAGPSTRAAHAELPAEKQESSSPDKKGAAPRRKRRRVEDRNEFLPDRPVEELEEQTYGSLEFDEVLDEEILKNKFVVVNRAPIMTAWSFIVAERLGFKREEALSIASVYTEMNAISKGASMGIYDKGKEAGREASRGGAQPYVDLMGRSPLYQTAKSTWLALSAGKPVSPAAAYSYIARSLRQTAPFVVGALRLLAASYTPAELTAHGFALYAELRPEVDGWGKRAEVRCATILGLRKEGGVVVRKGGEEARSSDSVPAGREAGGGAVGTEAGRVQGVVKVEEHGEAGADGRAAADDGPARKKARTMAVASMSLEEYEAALDADDTFAGVDLDFARADDSSASASASPRKDT